MHPTTSSICASKRAQEGLPAALQPCVFVACPTPPEDAAPTPLNLAFVVDSNLPQAALPGVVSAITAAVDGLPAGSCVSLITFAGVVKVFELGVRGVASCNVLPGGAPLSEAALEAIEAHERLPPTAGGEYLAPVHVCGEALGAGLATLRGGVEDSPRAVGVACRAGVAVLDARREGDRLCRMQARMVVFLGGPPTVGPAALPDLVTSALVRSPTAAAAWGTRGDAGALDDALEYYQALGGAARRAGAAVDVVCVGPYNFGVGALQAMAGATGGSVLLHATADAALAADVKHLLHVQAVGDVTMTITVDEPLYLQRVIGPVCRRQDVGGEAWGAEGEATRPAAGGDVITWSYDLYLPRVDPGTGVVLCFGTSADATAASVQVSSMVTARGPRWPLTTVEDVIHFTVGAAPGEGTLDDVAAAVMVAKDAVQTAASSTTEAGLGALDAACKALAGTIRTDSTLPATITAIIEHLYHARRGVLLGPLLHHPDVVAAMRGLFLRAALEPSVRLVHPGLRRLTPQPGPLAAPPFFLDVPLSTLALQSHTVLVLDHHTQVFVWVGRDVAGDAYAPSVEAAAALAAADCAGRYPTPQCMTVVEDHSMARWLTCRLAPAHHDSPAQQVAGFPALGAMEATALARLRAKLLRSDEPSLHSFRASLLYS